MTIVAQVVFRDDGTREVRTISRTDRLRNVIFTKDDQDIIDNLNPFALTVKDIPLYKLKYKGKEMADELSCYVFTVKPKSTKGGRFYFEGKIWVDDLDFQIVKTLGRAVPQTMEQQFPEFETIRQMIDGKYWFPVWTHADSNLQFTNPDPRSIGFVTNTIRIEETITYDNYKKFTAKTTIRFPDTDDTEKK